MNLVAISVVAHKGVYVSVVVSVIYGSRMSVVRREMIPMPGRAPDSVCGHVKQMSIDQRGGHEYRTHDVVGTIDIRITDDLDIRIHLGCLSYYGSNVLIDVFCKYSLNQNDVIVTLDSLENSQIVYVTVTVQVEV